MEHAGATRIETEVGNALGELNRSRPRLAAYVDANRPGDTRASYAQGATRLLYGIDLFIVRYGIPAREVPRIRITATRKSYGATFALEEGAVRRRPTAVGAAPALEVATERIMVGSEMGGMETAWMLRRPKRVQEWVANDNVADAVEELFHAMDRHCDVNQIDPRFLTVDGIFERGLRYVDLTFQDDTPDRLRR